MDVIQVVDIPAASSADEAQRLLNAPCAENRCSLVQVLQLPGGAARAIYRLRVPRAVTGRRSIASVTVSRSLRRQDRTETDNAIVIQQRIERVLKRKGLLSRRQLYQFTNGRRDGRANWDKVLEGMVLQGLVHGQRAGETGVLFDWAKKG